MAGLLRQLLAAITAAGGEPMKPDRLNAFTDGVVAIIITIMVLELRVPTGASIEALNPVWPVFAAYALSFVNVAIFWNNHHHMLQLARKVDGRVLWANAFLLFWLSLIPFVIRWINDEGITAWPTAAYGIVLVMASIGYSLLERTLIAADGESAVAEIVHDKRKELLSTLLYFIAIPAAFVSPWISVGAYVTVAAIWLIPDRRFER
jgi:uncharacterized membrane protein